MGSASPIVDHFERVIQSSAFRIMREVHEKDITITIHGKNGTAEVEFCADGEIIAMIEIGHVVHTWHIFPNDQDFKASARKIREFIG